MILKATDLAGDDPRPMSIAEVIKLQELCRELPANPVIIQIGAERGCSTMAMLEARPEAFIFSIDIGERVEERVHLAMGKLPTYNVVRGLGSSQEIGQNWPIGWQCDLLFIDGDHRRPWIDLDIILWANSGTVKKGGILAFHDYIPDPPAHIRGRVAQAVDEWMNKAAIPYYCLVGRLIAFKM